MNNRARSGPQGLGEIVRFFLRLGLTAFGGPAAHIGLMERDAVERRGWLSREEFLDLVGACNLLPGPSSTQVAMTLGYRRAGWLGLVIAGVCFIVPAALMTLAMAWAYVHYGSLPRVQGLLYGAKPVMEAIVAQAIWNLGRKAFYAIELAFIGAACLLAAELGVAPIAILLAAGAIMLAAEWVRSRRTQAAGFGLWPTIGATGAALAAPSLAQIAIVFLKLGVVVIGSGYVLLAFLKADLIDRLHWLTETQLVDAVTAGQVTPGPVFATAAFIGYLLHGYSGAAVATAAIFLPLFLMAGLVGAMARRIRRAKLAASFLNGVNAAAVALMASVAWALGRATLVDRWTWALGLASAVLLVGFRVNATWLILGGAALGILLRGLQ